MERVWSSGLKEAVRAMKKNESPSTSMSTLTDMEKSLVANSMQQKRAATAQPADLWD